MRLTDADLVEHVANCRVFVDAAVVDEVNSLATPHRVHHATDAAVRRDFPASTQLESP